jgi:hypothetical protein
MQNINLVFTLAVTVQVALSNILHMLPLQTMGCPRVTLMQVASQAVATMPSVLLWPLLPFVLEVGLIVYWVAVTAVLYSAGVPTANWRQPEQAYQPLGFQQLMLTNSSMAMPPPPAKPDTSNMTAAVSDGVVHTIAATLARLVLSSVSKLLLASTTVSRLLERMRDGMVSTGCQPV